MLLKHSNRGGGITLITSILKYTYWWEYRIEKYLLKNSKILYHFKLSDRSVSHHVLSRWQYESAFQTACHLLCLNSFFFFIISQSSGQQHCVTRIQDKQPNCNFLYTRNEQLFSILLKCHFCGQGHFRYYLLNLHHFLLKRQK